MTRDLAAVIAGGAVGTALRLGLDALIPHGDDTFPVSTLVINVVGAFALGLLVARLWSSAPSWLLAGLGAGLLGSFTTFSALAVSLVTLASSDQWMTALGYLAATLLLGFGAAAGGLALGHGRAPLAPLDPPGSAGSAGRPGSTGSPGRPGRGGLADESLPDNVRGRHP